jgi:hypothetical protein
VRLGVGLARHLEVWEGTICVYVGSDLQRLVCVAVVESDGLRFKAESYASKNLLNELGPSPGVDLSEKVEYRALAHERGDAADTLWVSREACPSNLQYI